MRAKLFIVRLQRCAAREVACAICAEVGLTILFDCDLIARVCGDCGEQSGIAQIELWAAGLAVPETILVQANP